MQFGKGSVALAGLSLAFLGSISQAASLTVKNFSFEHPNAPSGAPFVVLSADNWDFSGPGPFVDIGAGPQNSGTGVFLNPPGFGPVANGDGNQAAYQFTKTGNLMSQALVDDSNAPINFTLGQQYSITIGAANAGQAPASTDQLLAGLYYLNAGVPQLVAQSIIKNDGTASGTVSTQFTDYTAISPVLQAGDPSLNKQIFVQISTIGAGSQQWDVDNVRVTAVPEPASLLMLGIGAIGLMARRRRR